MEKKIMKWIPLNQKEPELDRPLLITVQYEGNDYKEVTDSEYVIDSSSDIHGGKTFQLGSAKNFKVYAWMYQPEISGVSDGVLYLSKWVPERGGNEVTRRYFS